MNILSKSLESQKRALTLEKCKRKARMIAYKISINNDRCKEDDGNYLANKLNIFNINCSDVQIKIDVERLMETAQGLEKIEGNMKLTLR